MEKSKKGKESLKLQDQHIKKVTSSQKKVGEIKRIFASGGVVYKNSNRRVLWLVAQNSPSKDFPKIVWRLPKGRLDDEVGEDKPGPMARGEIKATELEIQKSAVREIGEEGGVDVRVVKKIGTEKYFYDSKQGFRIFEIVTFYLAKWLSDLKDGYGFETSEVLWLPYEDARQKLSYSGERKVLDKAKAILDMGVQNTLV